MSFQEVSKMSLKMEFVSLAVNLKGSFSDLCKSFNISRQNGYKWLNRFKKFGQDGLKEKSRRPKSCPKSTREKIVDFIVAKRSKYPCWGARKIKRLLKNARYKNIPSHTAINKILNQKGLINPKLSQQTKPYRRFQYLHPNEMWQMDFKGDFPIASGQRCHPLTIIDDCSRFLVCVESCQDQRSETVKKALIKTFKLYGCPKMILIDNGGPWANVETQNRLTTLSLWLVELGIKVIFARPNHPQTKGKNERLNRTLKDEVISLNTIMDFKQAQKLFDEFRQTYNLKRPHEALNYDIPSQHYRPSPRRYTGKIEQPKYMTDDIVRKVDMGGKTSFGWADIFVGRAFAGKLIAIRETKTKGKYNVFFYNQIIKTFELKSKKK